jgi:two-component system response regulator YesN
MPDGNIITTRFVIVEDEVMIREGLCACVDWPALGAEVVGSAANGREGLDLILEQYPDVIITDVVMPQMNGLDMVMNLRRQGWEGDVVLEYLRRALHCEAIDYIFKPVENDDLLAVINRTIERVHQKKVNQHASFEQRQNGARTAGKTGFCVQVDQIIAGQIKSVCIDSLADSLHMSRSSLIRLIKQYYSKTVNDLIIEAKMDYACKLLKSTPMHIHEISDTIGYKDIKHFTSLFRRQTGLLPSEYRRVHSA